MKMFPSFNPSPSTGEGRVGVIFMLRCAPFRAWRLDGKFFPGPFDMDCRESDQVLGDVFPPGQRIHKS